MKKETEDKYWLVNKFIGEINKYSDPKELDEKEEVQELLDESKPAIIGIKQLEKMLREEIENEEEIYRVIEISEAIKNRLKELNTKLSEEALGSLSRLDDTLSDSKNWEKAFGKQEGANKQKEWEKHRETIRKIYGILERNLIKVDKEAKEKIPEASVAKLAEFEGYSKSFHDEADDISDQIDGLLQRVTARTLPWIKEFKRGLNESIQFEGLINSVSPESSSVLEDQSEDKETARLSDQIYQLRTKFDQKAGWLKTRVDTFKDLMEKLKQIRDKELTVRDLKNSKDKEDVSLLQAFYNSDKSDDKSEIIKNILANFGTLKDGIKQLIIAKDRAKANVGDNDQETLDNLLLYDKKFDKDFGDLKKLYESVYPKIKPSDLAKAMPESPYEAKLPDHIKLDNLKFPKSKVTLGEGGFGSVGLLVHDDDKKETVAYKVLNFEAGDLEEQRIARRDLRKEVTMYERIGDHPNILKVYGITNISGKEALLMEVMDGGTAFDNLEELDKLYAKGGVTDQEYVGFIQHVMKSALQGLAHMHKMGYTHVDMKFPNVLMSSDGSVKVMDLGLTEKSETIADAVPVNPLFTDPHLTKDKIAETHHDVFSAGLSLFEIDSIYKFKRIKEFDYGDDNVQSGFKTDFEEAGQEWIKDAANRVFTKMDEGDKQEMKREIAGVRNEYIQKATPYSVELQELRNELEESEKKIKKLEEEGKDASPAIEAYKEAFGKYNESFALKKIKEFIDESQKEIEKIRAKYLTSAGASYISQYMDFMNKIMHPDPNQRLSALEALDEPFLTEAFIQDETEARSVLLKINPELAKPKQDEGLENNPIDTTSPLDMDPLPDLSTDRVEKIKEEVLNKFSTKVSIQGHIQVSQEKALGSGKREELESYLKYLKGLGSLSGDPIMEELMKIRNSMPTEVTFEYSKKGTIEILNDARKMLTKKLSLCKDKLKKLTAKDSSVLSSDEKLLITSLRQIIKWIEESMLSILEIELTHKAWDDAFGNNQGVLEEKIESSDVRKNVRKKSIGLPKRSLKELLEFKFESVRSSLEEWRLLVTGKKNKNISLHPSMTSFLTINSNTVKWKKWESALLGLDGDNPLAVKPLGDTAKRMEKMLNQAILITSIFQDISGPTKEQNAIKDLSKNLAEKLNKLMDTIWECEQLASMIRRK